MMKDDAKERVDAAKAAYLEKTHEVEREKKSLPARLAALRDELTAIKDTLSDRILRGGDGTDIDALRERLAAAETEHATLAHRKNELFSETWVDKLPEVADVRAELDAALIEFGKSNLHRYNELLASVETAREAYFQAIREVFDCYRNFYKTDKIPGFESSKVARPRSYQFEIGIHQIGKACGDEPRPVFGL